MRRVSYYVSQDAAQQFDEAVARVMRALGGDVPKHIALSALICAGAGTADQVAEQLATARAQMLAQQLEELRSERS